MSIDLRTAPHEYTSTACFHADHVYCQSDTGAAGTKVPGVCKFCHSECECPCHEGVDMTGVAAPEFVSDPYGVWWWACGGGRGCAGSYRYGWASREAARADWDKHIKDEHGDRQEAQQ